MVMVALLLRGCVGLEPNLHHKRSTRFLEPNCCSISVELSWASALSLSLFCPAALWSLQEGDAERASAMISAIRESHKATGSREEVAEMRLWRSILEEIELQCQLKVPPLRPLPPPPPPLHSPPSYARCTNAPMLTVATCVTDVVFVVAL